MTNSGRSILSKSSRLFGETQVIHFGEDEHVAGYFGMINEIGSYIGRALPTRLQKSLKFLDIGGGGFWPEQGEWLNPQNTLKGKLIQLLEPDARFRSARYRRKCKPLDHFAEKIAETLSA